MTRVLSIRNRQRTRRLNSALLRRVTLAATAELIADRDWEIGIHLVSTAEIARLNREFLRHDGATDVITFSYADAAPGPLSGEILICVEEALKQARRFRTTWQEEVVRYIVHGLLHLRGHDDRVPGPRRLMKRAEDRLVRRLRRDFPLGRLGRAHGRPAGS